MTHTPSPTLADEIEARILSACIEEPEIRKSLVELEPRDFADLRNQRAFEAVRNLDAYGKPINAIAVSDYVEQLDRERDTFVADKVNLVYLAGLLAVTVPYGENHTAAIADARWLRNALESRERGEAAFAITGSTEVASAAAAAADYGGFSPMPSRVAGERDRRMHLAARALNFHNAFLDDSLRAILPHDLVLLGAPSGMGKTDLSLGIGMANAMAERYVAYFALEAEPDELERRVKYAFLSAEAHRRQVPMRNDLNYPDWLLGKCEDIVGPLNEIADQHFLSRLGGLWTFYRGSRFTHDDLRKEILKIYKLVDLIIVDHLHYIDADTADENEAKSLGDTVKAIRDISLRIGKPIILVAHLRKRDQRLRQIMPTLDDFHGSSNVTKICTQAITIERASGIDAPKWWLSPTFMSVIKDRRAGTTGLVALTYFDRRTRSYEQGYTLGRLIKGNTEWEPIKPGEQPSWARGHRQLELELT